MSRSGHSPVGDDAPPERGEHPRAVIVGGGVAALETLLALRALAGHRIELTLVSAQRTFLYRPVTVAEAFDRGEARAYSLAAILADGPGEMLWDRLERVDTDRREVVTASGRRVPYDVLVLAAGALPVDWLPGAVTFTGRDAVSPLRALLADLVAGTAGSVAFVVPPGQAWPLPIYELALMTAGHLREHGVTATVRLVTPERAPLELFGPAAAQAIGPMLEARGVTVMRGREAAHLERGTLVLAGGERVLADRVVTLPELTGPRLPGLPSDDAGFIPVDGHGRVRGVPGVYAAGDATSFPLKQGGLAAQQADVVAATIACELGLGPRPPALHPVLRGLLLTGGAPLYLRAELGRHAQPAVAPVDTRSWPGRAREASAAAGQALWWPPAKIAGRHLSAYLAGARPEPLSAEVLADRAPEPGPDLAEGEFSDALELALLLADCDANWGDYGAALQALDAAETLQGTLTPEYAAKRREWQASQRA
ncbi:MAG TPA: FAD-dependent oxidoreductase [Solirubrobacteraceae bacterium]|nr:FAD-dependent oxidoreductase [Solirubrobacteraceae bacterium]